MSGECDTNTPPPCTVAEFPRNVMFICPSNSICTEKSCKNPKVTKTADLKKNKKTY